MTYEYPIKIGLSSVDRAGVMFFPELFRHAHDAYEMFMGSLGEGLAGLLEHGNYLLPVAHAQADYLMPLRHGEGVRVTLLVKGVGESSFSVDYGFFNGQENLCAKASTVHVCVAADGGRSQPIPPILRKKLQACMGDN